MEVIKRDGRTVFFERQKIIDAIGKAMEKVGQVDYNTAYEIANEIEDYVRETDSTPTVEDIQDMVENCLMVMSTVPVAKEYIRYRNMRNVIREKDSRVKHRVRGIINCDNVQNSNANMDEYSFGGRKFESAGALHKEIAFDDMISEEVKRAFDDSYIYIHDLDSYSIGMHNCLFVDMQKLLAEGFVTRNGDVRPAGNFSTACQLVAVIFQCQSQGQFGGVGSAHIDYDLAPYVQKSFDKLLARAAMDRFDMDEVEIRDLFPKPYPLFESVPDFVEFGGMYCRYDEEDWVRVLDCYEVALRNLEREGLQSAQGLFHNLNTLESRPGSQLPFTSINFGLDTTPEGRMVTRWLLEASLDGIGKYNKTSIFPISIFQYDIETNAKPWTPNYDLYQLAIKSLSHRIYPNFANVNWSGYEYDRSNPDTAMATMGK